MSEFKEKNIRLKVCTSDDVAKVNQFFSRIIYMVDCWLYLVTVYDKVSYNPKVCLIQCS